MDRIFTIISGKVSGWAGKPINFIVATAPILIWAASGPVFRFSDTWQLVVNTTTTICLPDGVHYPKQPEP